MNWAWRLGMAILTGVPGIVGGGFMWYLTEKWAAVIIYEVLLVCVMSWLIAKGDKNDVSHAH
ncbi:MAG: hypothetical protein ACLGPL_12595 [Acidobacteriota bacterium]